MFTSLCTCSHFALYMYQEEQSRRASVFKDETFQAAAKIFKLISSLRSGIRKPGILQIWASLSLQGWLRTQFPATSPLQRRSRPSSLSSHLLPQNSTIFNISKTLCLSVRSVIKGREFPKLYIHRCRHMHNTHAENSHFCRKPGWSMCNSVNTKPGNFQDSC